MKEVKQIKQGHIDVLKEALDEYDIPDELIDELSEWIYKEQKESQIGLIVGLIEWASKQTDLVHKNVIKDTLIRLEEYHQKEQDERN